MVSFTATSPNITTYFHTGGKPSLLSRKNKYFATKLRSSFSVSYQKTRDVGMKPGALKAKDDCSIFHPQNFVKDFQKLTILSSLTF